MLHNQSTKSKALKPYVRIFHLIARLQRFRFDFNAVEFLLNKDLHVSGNTSTLQILPTAVGRFFQVLATTTHTYDSPNPTNGRDCVKSRTVVASSQYHLG